MVWIEIWAKTCVFCICVSRCVLRFVNDVLQWLCVLLSFIAHLKIWSDRTNACLNYPVKTLSFAIGRSFRYSLKRIFFKNAIVNARANVSVRRIDHPYWEECLYNLTDPESRQKLYSPHANCWDGENREKNKMKSKSKVTHILCKVSISTSCHITLWSVC